MEQGFPLSHQLSGFLYTLYLVILFSGIVEGLISLLAVPSTLFSCVFDALV